MTVPQINDQIIDARNLRDKGDYKSASALLQRLHSKHPEDPRVWREQAIVLMQAREYKHALALFTHAHQAFGIAENLSPNRKHQREARRERANTAYHSAVACASMGEYELALNWLEVATGLYEKGEGCSAHQFHGSMLYLFGLPVPGFLAHDRALNAKEDDHPARFNKALIRMLRGEYREGFELFESRLELPHAKPHREVDLPRWTGTEVGRVLVVSEQGLGDSIMMERYISHIPHAIVSVQPPLGPWFLNRGHRVSVNPNSEIEADYWVPMMSLPRIFGVIPPSPKREWVTKRDMEHLFGATPRVGICWAGNPDHANDHDRSMPYGWERTALTALCEYEWVNLTHGQRLDDDVFQPKDFLETAQLIETLDAVVTVDTAVAHLAGTLGVPTVMLAPTAPEWRWGLDKDTTPWYPSMQIVRRKHTNDWPRAIEEAAKRLKEIL